MAPEVIKQLKHGRHADIWSVGYVSLSLSLSFKLSNFCVSSSVFISCPVRSCTVIEMATGSPPWSEFTDLVSALFHIGSSNDIPQIPERLSPDGKVPAANPLCLQL
jgi:serine/threonine protein kinase